MAKIGFIGMGNMGYAMLSGMLKIYDKEELIFTDANHERMKSVFEDTGVNYALSNGECANNAKILILAVKPQFYGPVLKNIENLVEKENIVISIAPGVTIAELQDSLGPQARIVRAMPNTPALIGEGMTGVSYNKDEFTEDEIKEIEKIFNSFGKMIVVDEKLMSCVTCASGSSPAYAYIFIEAMADGLVKYGMPREMAYEFVSQTLLGSAKMVMETKEHPGKLKDMVCSPGGTTIAGVSALEENGFRNSIIKATEQCYKKAERIV